MILYYLKFRSDNLELDKSWNISEIHFYSDIPMNIGEKISFNTSLDELQTEYKTKTFKIIDKVVRIDEIEDEVPITPFVEIILEPFYI